MRTFLGVCLLLGVAAVLIPSTFGRICSKCGPNQSLYEKKCEDGTVNETCYNHEGGTPRVCMTHIDSYGTVMRSCFLPSGMGLKEDCHAPPDIGMCQCDTDFCNEQWAGWRVRTTPRSDGGQQLGLKGGSFGILGVVLLLGGVGLIRGQLLWG